MGSVCVSKLDDVDHTCVMIKTLLTMEEVGHNRRCLLILRCRRP